MDSKLLLPFLAALLTVVCHHALAQCNVRALKDMTAAGVLTKMGKLQPHGQQVALFYCEAEGMELRGVGFKLCIEGEWSDPELNPRCTKESDCNRLPPVEQGQYNASYPHYYSSIVKLRCNDGYTLINGQNAKCLLRGWSRSSLGTCQKTCILPTTAAPLSYSISQGDRIPGTNFVPLGSRLMYSCAGIGQKIKGTSTSVCRENGWSSNPPYCQARACRLDKLLNQAVEPVRVSPREQRYFYDESVTISCSTPATHYLHPSNASQFTCRVDKTRNTGHLAWSYKSTKEQVTAPLDVTCKRSCVTTSLGRGAGMNYLIQSPTRQQFRVGERVSFSCGNRLLKPSRLEGGSLVCGDGEQWTLNGQPFTGNLACYAAQCPRQSVGRLMIDPRKERYMASDTVHFSCRNWTLEGSSSSTCVRDMNTGDLHWSPEWPACVYRAPPCDSFYVANGEIVSSSLPPYAKGSTIGILCDECYKPNGRVYSQCEEEANWRPDIQSTQCVVRTCPTLSNHRDQMLRKSYIGGPQNSCGSTVRFSCVDGYSLLGDSELHCLPSGKWSGCVPKCYKSRCDGAASQCLYQSECQAKKFIDNSVAADTCECVPESQCPDCPELQPVCGSNATSYRSRCHMYARRCKERKFELTEALGQTGKCFKAGVCSEPKPNGTCSARSVKWFYDIKSRKCQRYNHGPCMKGENSFDFETDCRKRCMRAPDPCSEKMGASGTCLNFQTRSTYNKKKRRCVVFPTYSGCGGNGNNFRDAETCQIVCAGQPQSSDPAAQRPTANLCHGKQCREVSMRDACPPNDTHVFVVLGRVNKLDHDTSETGTTLFQTHSAQFLHSPKFFQTGGSLTFYNLWRVDGGDATCGCPDLVNGQFFIIGRVEVAGDQRSILAVTEKSFVQQFDDSNKGDLKSQFAVACPHLINN